MVFHESSHPPCISRANDCPCHSFVVISFRSLKAPRNIFYRFRFRATFSISILRDLPEPIVVEDWNEVW